MKRAANNDGDIPSKRPRTQSADTTDPFDSRLEKKVTDLYENGTDGTGFFSATAFMTWPIKKKARLNVETFADKVLYRFDIELSGKCASHFDKLRFHSRDVFQIALKGAKVDKTKSSSSPHSIAMTIRYHEGVIVKFITRPTKPAEDGQVVNTWKLQEAAKVQERSQDDWFSTPTKTSSDPLIQTGVTVAPKENPQPQGIRSKKRTKKFRKEQQAREAAAAAAAGLAARQQSNPPHVTSAHQASEPTTEEQPNPPRISSPHQAPAVPTPAPHSQITGQSPPISPLPSSEARDPALDVKIALFLNEDRDPYVPISEMQTGKFYNIIGVVISAGWPSKTRTGEWCRSLKMVDQSVCDVSDGYMDSRAIRVNCFTPTYEEWLPSPHNGDVLILRKVKAELYHDNLTATGLNSKLRWAAFDPETGKVRPRNMGSVPESEGLADGFGYQCNPFWTPKESELAYCLQISDWWRAVQKVREKDMGVVHQVGGNDGRMTKRQHRLIADASPNTPPNGFFDCTVEILHGHLNDNGVYSLYVTDYTANHEITPIQASWCPPELADRVLKIELWDAASELGQKALRGEYYSIRNNRLKVSRGGFVEGTFSEAEKMQKLEEPSDSHLQALLQRKKDWESTHSSAVGSSSSFEHRLIQDVEIDMFFNCTVEILHADYNERKPSCLYITDYTAHPNLPSKWDSESWSSGLRGRIVKVSLWDTQIEMAKNVEPGAFYSILNLRLKKTLTGNLFQGRLGGDERLIHKLKPVDTTNKELKALIARKEEWERATKNCVETDGKPQPPETDTTLKEPPKQTLSLLKRSPYSTIQEVLASEKCPNEFSVVARVIDYYPLLLNDCVIQQCTSCQMDVPEKYKACLACNDDAHEFIKYRYRFFLRLEDEDGSQIHISVSDEQCSLLHGLTPVNLQDDPDARQKFAERMETVIGNLAEVHDGCLQGIQIAPDTPMLRFTIESWEISVSDRPTRAYGFLEHTMA